MASFSDKRLLLVGAKVMNPADSTTTPDSLIALNGKTIEHLGQRSLDTELIRPRTPEQFRLTAWKYGVCLASPIRFD